MEYKVIVKEDSEPSYKFSIGEAVLCRGGFWKFKGENKVGEIKKRDKGVLGLFNQYTVSIPNYDGYGKHRETIYFEGQLRRLHLDFEERLENQITSENSY